MENSVLGKLVICFLLLVVNGRIFFIKESRRDAVSVFAAVALLLSVLYICVNSLDLMGAAIFVVSALTFITNVRALLRFTARLVVDRYSAVFQIFSVLCFLCALALVVICVYFAPVKIDSKKLGTVETVQTTLRYTGSFESGFIPAQNFQKANAFFTIVKPVETVESDFSTVVAMLIDKRASVCDYVPYMTLLAQKGFTVVAADFFTNNSKYFSFDENDNEKEKTKTISKFFDTKVFRKFMMRSLFYKSPKIFDEQKEHFAQKHFSKLLNLEIIELEKFIKKELAHDGQIFFVGDGMTSVPTKTFAEENIYGFFALDSVAEYKTAGMGSLEAADPLAAKILFGEKKDASFFIARYLALATKDFIGAYFSEKEENR